MSSGYLIQIPIMHPTLIISLQKRRIGRERGRKPTVNSILFTYSFISGMLD